MKKVLHNILGLWLAILLLFGSTPKEYIHLFAGHTDTIHSVHEKDGLVIEPEHHHCTFLSYALPLFINDVQVIQLHTCKAVYPVYHSYIARVYIKRPPGVSHLRGPPALLS